MTFTYRHRKQIILCGLGLVLLLVVASIFIYKNFTAEDKEDENIVLNTKKDIKKNEEEEEVDSDIYYQIDIKGEVVNPGIYTVKEGSRVIDVIRLAGDLTEVADTSVLNLSRKLKMKWLLLFIVLMKF